MEHTEADQTTPVRWGDSGPFSIIPLWIVEGDLSDRAVRIYALLARHAGAPGASTFRGKRELSERLRCGKTTVDRAMHELVAAGAVSVEDRWARNGAQLENTYIIHATPPSQTANPPVSSVTPPPPADETPSRAGSSLENPEGEPRTEIALGASRQKWRVDRALVSDEHYYLSRNILSRWNTETGQRLASTDWLAKIVMRLREHPELGYDDHVEIILANLSHPWWTGPPTPSVVYGNGAQFERAMVTQAQGQTAGGDGALAVALDEQRRMEAGR